MPAGINYTSRPHHVSPSRAPLKTLVKRLARRVNVVDCDVFFTRTQVGNQGKRVLPRCLASPINEPVEAAIRWIEKRPYPKK